MNIHAGVHNIDSAAELAELPETKPVAYCSENKRLFALDPQDGYLIPNQLPIGFVFLSVVDDDPADLLGYGVWAAIAAGRMLVGFDSGDADFDTEEEIGGAKTVTLTEAQMPSHTHVQNSHNHTQDAHLHLQDAHTHLQNSHSHVITSQTATTGGATSYEHGVLDTSSAETEATETTNPATATNQNATAVNQNATATNQAAIAVNQNAGSGQAHNNMPPFFVVRMWKRVS